MCDSVLVYDDACGFCTWCASVLCRRADFDVVGFGELEASYLERLPREYEASAHLLTEDAVYSGGASVEEALLRTSRGERFRPVVSRLRDVAAYRWVREGVYRLVAANRAAFGRFLSSDSVDCE